jgi:hypothetical protein
MARPALEPKPEDPVGMLLFVSATLLAAKIIAVRGQPMNKGDVAECVDAADLLLGEVVKRAVPS